MSELIYLQKHQAPVALFDNIGGLYLIKPSYRDEPYIGRLGLNKRDVKTFTGTSPFSYELGLKGFFVCRADGEAFIPHHDVQVLGVFINAKVAK